VVRRSRIGLLAHQGWPNQRIGAQLGTSRPTVLLWRSRFAAGGPSALEQDAPRGPSPQRLDPAQIKAIVERTWHTTPPDATHWGTRTLAKACGVSHMTVARIWDAHGLQPHRVRTFKLSRDPALVAKLTDVVGLHLNPPDKALVLGVDEKSQIPALDRTQPGLPMKPGRCGTLTHDYLRHGTTSLLAALNVAVGLVIGGCFARQRHEKFLKFLRQSDRQPPPELALHLIVDNNGTPKHARVRPWLAAHPRFRLHFTPTGSS
jgi:transposase